MRKHSLILVLLLGLFPGCQANLTTTKPSPSASVPTQANAGDQAFIDGMVPHHEMALMMADDALDKASHTELRTFATKVKEDQNREITQMKAYRQQWFGSSATPPMDHSQMMMMPASLSYDKDWSEQMIKHHQDAIDMAKQALTAASRPELKQMAQAIIDAQTKEQTQLRGYINAWYPTAALTPASK